MGTIEVTRGGAAPDADIGIVSDFIFEGGAEAVVDNLCRTFPAAAHYTSVYDPKALRRYPAIEANHRRAPIRAGFSQIAARISARFPWLSVYHFYWLYFLSAAVQRTAAHDVVIYSCCAQSKLIRAPEGARTVVYFHTPTRWLYPGLVTEADLAAIPAALRWPMKGINRLLRPLDRLGVKRLKRRAPVWLANSSYTRDRVQRHYGVACEVVFPPVDTAKFSAVERRPSDFFVYHGRLTFQKRVDVAIQGCIRAGRRLFISGEAISPEVDRHLRRTVEQASGGDPNRAALVTFLGRTTDEKVRELFRECAAMIFPPREDFGIAPIEAMAAGVPVIAYRDGGALDYIRPGVNGAFFNAQTGDALAEVLRGFDAGDFDAATVAASIPDVSAESFSARMREIASRHD